MNDGSNDGLGKDLGFCDGIRKNEWKWNDHR